MPEPKAKGKGLGKKVAGLPLWVWGAALIGGLLVGIYLRRSGGGTQAPQAAPADTSGLGDLSGIATTPSANGLGSATTDGAGAFDSSGLQMALDNIASELAMLSMNAQEQSNFGPGGFTDNPPASATIYDTSGSPDSPNWHVAGLPLAFTMGLPPGATVPPVPAIGAVTVPSGVLVTHPKYTGGFVRVKPKPKKPATRKKTPAKKR